MNQLTIDYIKIGLGPLSNEKKAHFRGEPHLSF